MVEQRPTSNSLHRVLARTGRRLSVQAWDARNGDTAQHETLMQQAQYVRELTTYAETLGEQTGVNPKEITVFDAEVLPLRFKESRRLLHDLVKKSGLTQDAIGNRLGRSKSWLDKVMRGEQKIPSSGFTHVLCDVLGLAEDDLDRKRLAELVVQEERRRAEKDLQRRLSSQNREE